MKKLHIFFLPSMAHGHTIPMIDMAKLFTSHGVKATIICTPAFAEPIENARDSGFDIGLIKIKFPPEESGLPDNIVSLEQVTNDLMPNFGKALALLQEPVEKLIQKFSPNCIISDMFFPWTVESAAKFGIPRLVFHGTCNFSLCATAEMIRHKPFRNLSSDSASFLLSNLPHCPKFVRTQVAQFMLEENGDGFAKVLEQVVEADWRSYGVVVNSFHELEPEYADYYRRVLGIKAWQLGPLLLCNSSLEEKTQRGKRSVIDAQECITWLDHKKPNSVVYVSFGSWASFSPAQIHEIAIGLESSGQHFIWVVRKSTNEHENECCIPKGFEERMKDKGLIIRGWAPQMLILDHPTIGAFVTHCGWNSIIEGICAGVPLVTWPLFGEQFFNEKLVTEVLRCGISVGNKKWQQGGNEGVAGEAVSKTVQRVMVGEEALEVRSRAKYYMEMGKKAFAVGGSSYTCISDLIQELSSYGKGKNVILDGRV